MHPGHRRTPFAARTRIFQRRRLPLNSPVFRLAADVLQQMDPRGALFRWEGASIPVVAMLQHLSGAAPLLVGFGREEDKNHCPNESFGLDQLSSNLAALASELIRAKPAASRGRYLRQMSVSSTMGPGVKVDVGAVEDFAKSAS